MSSGAGQPISPTLSPEVQEVMADWAKTLEAPGANPELLPMRGVGGDSRSRRRLEQHLRARHAEELGWFYGWKRFLAKHEGNPQSLVSPERAFKGLVVPRGLDRAERLLAPQGRAQSPLEHARGAVRWWPSALNRINLAVDLHDPVAIGDIGEWKSATSTHFDPSAAICTWRADMAALKFAKGEYFEAASFYLANVTLRAEPIEALSCVVASALSGDSVLLEAASQEIDSQSLELDTAIEDYSKVIEECGIERTLLVPLRGMARSGNAQASIAAILDTLGGQA